MLRLAFAVALLASPAMAATWTFDLTNPLEACAQTPAETLEAARAAEAENGCAADLVQTPVGEALLSQCGETAKTIFADQQSCESVRAAAAGQ